MDKRPVLSSSHTRKSNTKDDDRRVTIQRSACPWFVELLRGSPPSSTKPKKFNRLVSDHGPRQKRASAKNLQDLSQNEVQREHFHPRIDNFDQVVAVYCGLFFNALGDRRLVSLYVKSLLTAQSRATEQVRAGEKEEAAIFTVELAKVFAKTVYAAIAADILDIVDKGELQTSEHGIQYRRGYISVSGTKRYLVILLRENSVGESCAAHVMTEQRFDRHTLPFAHEPGKGRSKHTREKPGYINALRMAM